jgi:hypothetical protein
MAAGVPPHRGHCYEIILGQYSVKKLALSWKTNVVTKVLK